MHQLSKAVLSFLIIGGEQTVMVTQMRRGCDVSLAEVNICSSVRSRWRFPLEVQSQTFKSNTVFCCCFPTCCELKHNSLWQPGNDFQHFHLTSQSAANHSIVCNTDEITGGLYSAGRGMWWRWLMIRMLMVKNVEFWLIKKIKVSLNYFYL